MKPGDRYLSFADARRSARRRLPKGIFDYIDKGVGQQAGLAQLYHGIDAVRILPRVLGARRERSTELSLFGRSLNAPIVIAPTAMAGLVHPDGEVALARAATRHGFPLCLSTQSLTSVERLRAKVPDADIWMQLYVWQDRDLSLQLLERAAGAGADVLVMTVDTPYGVRKSWNHKNGFGMPFSLTPRNLADLCLHPGWFLRVALSGYLREGLPELGNYPAGLRPCLFGPEADARVALRRDLGWDDVAWVRDHWPGKLVLKGILASDDAERAHQAGADGIIVSSHGARNFDAAPAPIEVLPGIASLGMPMTVMADSGIRHGLDVLRYRVKGAQAVMVGRLPMWALAAAGEDGADCALAVLHQEYVEALDSAGIENDFAD